MISESTAKIKEIKIKGNDMTNHNKLRTYQKFKSSFTREPYLNLVRNRNQRCHLTRQYIKERANIVTKGPCPPQPPSPVDDEFHILVRCPLFSNERTVFFGKLGAIIPSFPQLSIENKFKTILCPTSAKAAKLANRFIQLMFNTRSKIDQTN